MYIRIKLDCDNCGRRRTTSLFVPDYFLEKHFKIGCDKCRRWMDALLPTMANLIISKHENGVSVKYMRA